MIKRRDSVKITFDGKYYYLKDIKHEQFIRDVAEILNDIVYQDEELLFRIQIPNIERIMDATRKFMQENNLSEEDCGDIV